MENFIEFSTENLGIVQSLINSEEEFEICSLDFVKMLLKQLHKSQDFELDLKLLKLIFFIANRKSEFIKQLNITQFLINHEKIFIFQTLELMVEKIRFF